MPSSSASAPSIAAGGSGRGDAEACQDTHEYLSRGSATVGMRRLSVDPCRDSDLKAASIDTNEPTRDEHLRSPDFFDTENYPEIRFASKRIEPLGGPRFRVVGDLTIKDVTREVELEATVEGVERDPFGNERLGVSARGTINRMDFGLRWQRTLESGGFLLGDEVKIIIDVSAIHAT